VATIPPAAAESTMRLNGNARDCEWRMLFCTKTATVMGTGATRCKRRECNRVTLIRQLAFMSCHTIYQDSLTHRVDVARTSATGLRAQCNSARGARCQHRSRCSCRLRPFVCPPVGRVCTRHLPTRSPRRPSYSSLYRCQESSGPVPNHPLGRARCGGPVTCQWHGTRAHCSRSRSLRSVRSTPRPSLVAPS
jgi:hypothetical protein